MKSEKDLTFYNDFFHSLLKKLTQKDEADDLIVRILSENARLAHYRKKEYVITRHERQRYLYFIVSGIYRSFVVKENGHELTDNFMLHPGEPFIAGITFDEGCMAAESVQALEEGELFLVPLKIINEMRTKYPWVNELIIRELCRSFEKYHELLKARSLKPAERYAWLHSRYPHLDKEIQGQYLASYLDMDRANYSRLHAAER